MLGEDQKELAATFFKPSIVENETINGVKYMLKNDLPVFLSVPTYIRCSVIEKLEKGDHSLFLAEVKEVDILENKKPLELRKTGWSYGG